MNKIKNKIQKIKDVVEIKRGNIFKINKLSLSILYI